MVANKTDDDESIQNQPIRYTTKPVGAVVCEVCESQTGSGAYVHEYETSSKVVPVDSYLACDDCISQIE